MNSYSYINVHIYIEYMLRIINANLPSNADRLASMHMQTPKRPLVPHR